MGVLWPEDYEKVFGKPTKWSLFSEDEDAYEAFRHTIMDSPHYVFDKKKLPFSGVKVYGYDLYLLKLYSDKKKAEGKKLFYIKDETPGLAKVLAFGYFDYRKETFYLMANSLIRKTEFQEKMKRHHALNLPVTNLKAQSEIRKCNIEAKDERGYALQLELFHPEGYRLKQDVACPASIAAAYALGQEADFTRWKGMTGKTLADTYTFYQDVSKLSEIKSIWERLHKLKEEPRMVPELRQNVWNQNEESSPTIENDNGRHLLAEKIILPLKQLLSKKVITPLVRLNETIDNPIREELSEIHCYLTGEKYRAEGCYYVKEKKIKVFAGAEFSIDVSSALRYSATDYKRRTFIKEHCSTRKSKYILKEDFCFDSVETATVFIMGQVVTGLWLWATEDCRALGEIIDEKVC